jgi:hypothetical protein
VLNKIHSDFKRPPRLESSPPILVNPESFAQSTVAGSNLPRFIFRLAMGKAIFFFAGLLLLSVLSADLIGSAAGSEMDAWGVLWDSKPRSRCEGLIGECFEEDEMQMDSEINRRFLAGRTYISYAALRANSVPCSKRGSSYYNCRSTSQANPYQRSCTTITRCARSTS